MNYQESIHFHWGDIAVFMLWFNFSIDFYYWV